MITMDRPSDADRGRADECPPLTPALLRDLLRVEPPDDLAAYFFGTLAGFAERYGLNADWWAAAGGEGMLAFLRVDPATQRPNHITVCIHSRRELAPEGWERAVRTDTTVETVVLWEGDYAPAAGPEVRA